MSALALLAIVFGVAFVIFALVGFLISPSAGTPVKPAPPRLSRSEKRRKRAMRRRGEEDAFLTDNQLELRANAAYIHYLRGDDDGGLPSPTPITERLQDLSDLGGLYISPNYDRHKHYRGHLNPDTEENRNARYIDQDEDSDEDPGTDDPGSTDSGRT